jgi:hypothetical protein
VSSTRTYGHWPPSGRPLLLTCCTYCCTCYTCYACCSRPCLLLLRPSLHPTAATRLPTAALHAPAAATVLHMLIHVCALAWCCYACCCAPTPATVHACGGRLCLASFPTRMQRPPCFPCLLMKTTYIQKQVKHLEHMRATYVYSHCNICNIQTKHLQHTSETGETFGTYTCNICVKTMQRPDRTFTTYNIKTLLAVED